ncbi:MAG: hypothetical protein AB1416_05795 [Actinomycetota bacterium]
MAAAAVGIAVAMPATAPPRATGAAKSSALDLAVFVVSRGEVTGIVSAVHRGERRWTSLHASLHGLTPGRKYRVVVSRRACSRAAGIPIGSRAIDLDAQSPTDVLISSGFEIDGHETVHGVLRDARSVRILNGDTGTHEVSCASRHAGRLAGSVLAQGEVRGIVAAAERGQRTARLSVSLHGLSPDARYRVFGSRSPCTMRHKGPASFVYSHSLGGGILGAQDVFVTELVRTDGGLSKARSVRIDEVATDGTSTQKACRQLQQWGASEIDLKEPPL